MGNILLIREDYFHPYQARVYNMEFLLRSQWLPREKLEELQLDGFKQLLKWAKERCPFYKDYPEVKELDDIKNLPILTKTILNKNFNEILVPEVPHVITTTGGTVSKTTVAGDKRLLAGWEERRFMTWYGIPEIKKYAYLWGSLETGQEAKVLGNKLWLPVEGLKNKDDAYRYLRLLGHFYPDYFKVYAGPLYVLARYAQDLNLEWMVKGKVKVIVTHCETLTKTMRDTITDVFGTQVFNFYGGRDLGSQGQDCEQHRDIHTCAERYVIESVDDRLLFTDILNYASPLIRYENQDVGEYGEENCPCGRGLPTLKPLIGRVLSYLQTKNDDWITGFIIYLPIMYYDSHFGTNIFKWVESYQIQQREKGKIKVLLKAWEHVEVPKDLSSAYTAICKYAKPEEFDVELEIVKEIPKSRTGKQLAVDTSLRRWE